jgi:uracil-DNA glycosylase
VADSDPTEERDRLIRSVRQRLESLQRAGLRQVPVPALPALVRPPTTHPTPRAPAPRVEVPTPVVPAPAPPSPVPIVPASVVPSLFGEPEIEVPIVAPGERRTMLEVLAAEVAKCVRCPILVANRTRTVFADGSPTARLMFVGEAPGADEDRLGVPFVGRAGQLLTDMITKGMGLTREEVYIANVIKSRPPENRTPEPDEVANCLPYLERQIAIVRPEFLCLLGKTAASALLDTALAVGRLRGRWHRYRGIPAIVTYHPSYLLRQPSAKKEAWDDLQMLMKAMGLKPPGRSRS